VIVGVLAVLEGRVPVSRLEERRQRWQGLDSRLTTKHGSAAVVVALGVERTIAWKATDVSLDDTVDGIFIRVPVNLWEEQRQRGLDSRLTTKRVVVAVVVGLVVDTVVGGGDVCDGLVVRLCRVLFLREERQQLLLEERRRLLLEERQRQARDLRLTTKHGSVAVVVVLVVVGVGRAVVFCFLRGVFL